VPTSPQIRILLGAQSQQRIRDDMQDLCNCISVAPTPLRVSSKRGDGQLDYSIAKMSKYRCWVPASSACRCSSSITQRNARSNDR
jgi:hypothetical protein